jgi:uncharacterized membrane protein
VLTFLITGNLAAAAAVAGTESLTKFALFYGHEWLWQRKCMQGMIKTALEV